MHFAENQAPQGFQNNIFFTVISPGKTASTLIAQPVLLTPHYHV